MRGQTPIVSIGLPVYNGEKFLAATLESIQAQTFGDFEVIISDNASTDATETICRSFAAGDNRILYQRNSQNVGFAANCNRLPPQSRGRFFKWAAADDLLHPDFLERCVTALQDEPGVVVASTRYRWIDEQGRPIPMAGRSPLVQMRKGLTSPRPHLRFRAVVLFLVTDAHTGSFYGLIRLSALKETKLVESYLGAEKVLLARLALQGRFVEIEDDLLVRRDHAANIGRRNLIQTERLMNPDSRGLVLPRSKLVAGYFRAIDEAPSEVSKPLCRLAILEKFFRLGAYRAWRLVERRR